MVAGEGILAAVEQEDNSAAEEDNSAVEQEYNSAVEEGSPAVEQEDNSAAAVVGIQVVVEVDNKQVVALGNHLQPAAAAQCSFAAAEKWEREGSFAAGDQLGSSLVVVAVAGGSSG